VIEKNPADARYVSAPRRPKLIVASGTLAPGARYQNGRINRNLYLPRPRAEDRPDRVQFVFGIPVRAFPFTYNGIIIAVHLRGQRLVVDSSPPLGRNFTNWTSAQYRRACFNVRVMCFTASVNFLIGKPTVVAEKCLATPSRTYLSPISGRVYYVVYFLRPQKAPDGDAAFRTKIVVFTRVVSSVFA